MKTSTLVPADKASTTKLWGQASTISKVCVPMEPVDPSKLSRFWKLSAPSKDLLSVRLSDAAVQTGADGSIHPSPVPSDPFFKS